MSVREKLLKAFDIPQGRVLSGENLARQLGVSRVAVWKHVRALVGMGFPIQSGDHAGYRLTPKFDPSLLEYAKRNDGWITPHYFFQTHTTQLLAKEGARASLAEGHLWLAEIQSKGRGRLERVWESAFGGLWFSLLLRPKLSAAQVPPLTLLAGLCLREAIAKICKVQATLKWPNDVMVGSRKIAGVLTEMSGQIDRTEWVVLGVGVNVNNPLSRGLQARAASLSQLAGKQFERARILEAFLNEFRSAYARFQKHGFEPFQIRYWSHYGRPKQPVRLQTGSGIIAGRAVGVDAHGAILIESRRKIHAIFEGEIIL